MSDLFTRPGRKIAKGCTNEEIWNDVPAKIGKAMGGREWFFEEEATAIHRLGISLGLGWRLPQYQAVQRPDRVDLITVRLNRRGLFDMEFLHCGEAPPNEAEPLRGISNLQYADLKPTYEREMYG